MTKVAVLLGGHSSEREISLVSGAGCAGALREEGYGVVEIDPAAGDLSAALLAAKPDVVFNALHGRFGEDGCVQGLLELLRIPYTHSGVLASALAMDKPAAKKVFAAAGIPVAEGRIVTKAEVLAGDVLPRPYVLKPLNEGSSVGVHIVREGDNGSRIDMDDWPFGDYVLAERFIPGREITVAVMGDRALGATEITSERGFYDYEAKYAAGGSRHTLPAPVSEAVAKEAMQLAERAHVALGCRGVSRTDFRYDETGGRHRLILLETNTQPGMTPTSLVPEQAAYKGMSYRALCRWMVEDASCDR